MYENPGNLFTAGFRDVIKTETDSLALVFAQIFT